MRWKGHPGGPIANGVFGSTEAALPRMTVCDGIREYAIPPLYLDSVLYKSQNPRLIIGRKREKSLPP